MKYFFFIFLCLPLVSHAQLNIELLHQLVQESKDEHEKQVSVRNSQAVVNTQEEINHLSLRNLKEKYRSLEDRYSMLGTILTGIGLGMQAGPIISDITAQQTKIISLISSRPALLPMALASEREFVEHAIQLGRYVTMLLVNIGDLNQMQVSDRRILLGFIINELRSIAGSTYALTISIQSLKDNHSAYGSPFTDFMNSDTQIASRIISKISP